jgi:predicted  nucleic acid-binding Zn-ribbon protein
MKHEKLLKEIQALESNLEFYRRDLKKFFRKLDQNYGIKPDDVDLRMEDIEDEIQELLKKEKKVKVKIERKLKGIKHARRTGRI